MPRGDKSSYTSKQQRKAEHIEDGYEERGLSHKEAQRRAWATVNKQDGGAKGPGGSARAASKSTAKKSTARKSAATKRTATKRTGKGAAKSRSTATKKTSRTGR
jgi:hypothetical protein